MFEGEFSEAKTYPNELERKEIVYDGCTQNGSRTAFGKLSWKEKGTACFQEGQWADDQLSGVAKTHTCDRFGI